MTADAIAARHEQLVALVVRALNAGTATGTAVAYLNVSADEVTAPLAGWRDNPDGRSTAFRFLAAAADDAPPILTQRVAGGGDTDPFEVWATPDRKVCTYVRSEAEESTR